MENKNVCIACLASDTRLHDMYRYGLVEIYEDITTIQITADESNYQHYLCSVCATQLMKCATFKEKCHRAQRLMNMLGSLPIQEVDRETYHLNTPLAIHTLHSMSLSTQVDYIKEEYDNVENCAYLDDFKDMSPINEETIETEDLKEEIDSKSYDNVKLFEEDIHVMMLSEEEQLAEIQRRKESVNYKCSLYKCEKCYKGFMTDVTYTNHMIRHDPCSGAHECGICGIRRASVRELRLHAASAHERHFLCAHCSHVTRSLHRAREHRASHGGCRFRCERCGSSFKASTTYLSHMRLRHPTHDRCPLCHKRFLGRLGLKMHMKRAHGECKKSLEEHVCDGCDVNFNSEDALERHRSVLSDVSCQDLRSCAECGFGFQTEELLQEHVDSVHAVDETAKCSKCDKNFANKRTLSKHIQRYHLGNLRAVRPAETEYVCEMCGTRCSSAVSLLNHQRTHTGEKPYQCPDCPKRFSVSQGLRIHIRTHTGERPFKCTNCPKAFKNKAALNRHNRVHTGVRPYACPHCLKAFSQSNSMKLHVSTVHLKMPAPYRNRRKNNSS